MDQRNKLVEIVTEAQAERIKAHMQNHPFPNLLNAAPRNRRAAAPEPEGRPAVPRARASRGRGRPRRRPVVEQPVEDRRAVSPEPAPALIDDVVNAVQQPVEPRRAVNPEPAPIEEVLNSGMRRIKIEPNDEVDNRPNRPRLPPLPTFAPHDDSDEEEAHQPDQPRPSPPPAPLEIRPRIKIEPVDNVEMVDIDGTQLQGNSDEDLLQDGEPMEDQEDVNAAAEGAGEPMEDNEDQGQDQDRNVDQDLAELEAVIRAREAAEMQMLGAGEPMEDEEYEDEEEEEQEEEIEVDREEYWEEEEVEEENEHGLVNHEEDEEEGQDDEDQNEREDADMGGNDAISDSEENNGQPGPSTRRDLRPRAENVQYFKKTIPPIVAQNPNFEKLSQIIDGHMFTINMAGEITINDNEMMAPDDIANYKPRKYVDHVEFPEPKVPTDYSEFFEIPKHIQEYSDAVARDCVQGGDNSKFEEAMLEDETKIRELRMKVSKIRDFPFTDKNLDLVWDTTPKTEAEKSMWPTHAYLSALFGAEAMLQANREECTDEGFSLPDNPMECVKEVRGFLRDLKNSPYTPLECLTEVKTISMVDVVERTEENEKFYAKFVDEFPKTAPELRAFMKSYAQTDRLRNMLAPRKFDLSVVLGDLLKMVHCKYMPRGGMYLKFLQNIAWHFQYRLKPFVCKKTKKYREAGWEMVVFQEERVFGGIDFNQFGEEIHIKWPFNIHDHLEAKAKRTKILAKKSDVPAEKANVLGKRTRK